jgi:hypothetical protein
MATGWRLVTGTEHLLWRTDGNGKLVVEANGRIVAVERLLPSLEARVTIGWICHGTPVAVTGVQPTTRAAMAAAQRILTTVQIEDAGRTGVSAVANPIPCVVPINARIGVVPAPAESRSLIEQLAQSRWPNDERPAEILKARPQSNALPDLAFTHGRTTRFGLTR